MGKKPLHLLPPYKQHCCSYNLPTLEGSSYIFWVFQFSLFLPCLLTTKDLLIRSKTPKDIKIHIEPQCATWELCQNKMASVGTSNLDWEENWARSISEHLDNLQKKPTFFLFHLFFKDYKSSYICVPHL